MVVRAPAQASRQPGQRSRRGAVQRLDRDGRYQPTAATALERNPLQQLPSPPQPIPAIAPIAPFGRDGIRVGATGLWNGRSWQIGPPLPDGSDIATIPGGPSAWMVGAWPAPRTGLTAEVRLGR